MSHFILYYLNTSTKSSLDDIVVEDDVAYIRNQLLVTAYLGTDKAVIEKLVSEMDAEIVGYMKLINTFQIEFREEKSYEELNRIADYLLGFSYIFDASLNFAAGETEPSYNPNDTIYLDGYSYEFNWVDLNGDKEKDDNEWVLSTSATGEHWNTQQPSGENWGLEALNLPEAWDYISQFLRTDKIKIGIYDDMFGDNPDLVDVYAKKYKNPVNITQSHGTHVTGILGANFDNGIGITGVSVNPEIYGYSVAEGMVDVYDIMEAYVSMVADGAQCLNVSYGYDDHISFAATMGNKRARKMIHNNAERVSSILKMLLMQGYDFVIVNSAGNGNDKVYVEDMDKYYDYVIYDPAESKYAGKRTYTGGNDPYYNYYLSAITDELVRSRIIVVGSVGNVFSPGQNLCQVSEFSNQGFTVDTYAPGEDIISTVPVSLEQCAYRTMSGTSMAAPHITGLAALIWQANPNLSGAEVKQIILESEGLPVVDKNQNQLTCFSKTYYLPDAQKCIEAALKAQGGSWIQGDLLPTGEVKGQVTDEKGQPIENIRLLFTRTSAGEANLDNYMFSANTKADGSFSIELPQGTYELQVYSDSLYYVPFGINGIEVRPDETKYLDTIVLIETSSVVEKDDAVVRGKLYNAITGTAVSGATVKVRSGWNRKDGEYVTTWYGKEISRVCDLNGEFELSMPMGQYTIEVSCEGYITGYFNVVAGVVSNTSKQSFVLTPILSSDEYRIVLTWGASPSDLDSHLTYYENGVQLMHLYYMNRTGVLDGKKVAALDLDDVTGYGPETVTLTVDVGEIGEGIFYYSVYDFTNRNNVYSTNLSYSNAVVRVYNGNELVETYVVPQNEKGTVWPVFRLSKDGLHSANEAFYSASASEVR